MIRETAETGLYEAESDSSAGKLYMVDLRGKGIDGDPHTCTCTRYAINKNRAGGDGYQGETCKHLREAYAAHNGTAASPAKTRTQAKIKKDTEEQEAADEFERIRVAASLQHILSDLES